MLFDLIRKAKKSNTNAAWRSVSATQENNLKLEVEKVEYLYTDYVAVLSSSKPHLGRCNRNSANSLSVRSENPRAFLSLQRLKTDSLNRIDFKEPGSFGLPTPYDDV